MRITVDVCTLKVIRNKLVVAVNGRRKSFLNRMNCHVSEKLMLVVMKQSTSVIWRRDELRGIEVDLQGDRCSVIIRGFREGCSEWREKASRHLGGRKKKTALDVKDLLMGAEKAGVCRMKLIREENQN